MSLYYTIISIKSFKYFFIQNHPKEGENLVDYLTGVFQIANVFLSVVAGLIALTLFRHTKKKDHLAWAPLIIVLVLFALEEIVGALRSFDIWSTAYLTHVIPSVLLGFLIWALVRQIEISRGSSKGAKQ